MHILTISTEHAPRHLKWLVGAYKLSAHHIGFAESLNGLGRLDCALRSAEIPYYNYIIGGKIGEPMDIVTDFHCLSNIWTMGMYEGLRILSQKLSKDSKLGKAHSATDEVNLLKQKFARVRIPLAKFEAASQSPTDYDYLSQSIGDSIKGWGWIVTDKTVIYRNELADDVLQLFDKFEETEASLLIQKKLT
ncbi:MAG: hypothetical protein AB1306_00305 [Nitrospirota bacterium]